MDVPARGDEHRQDPIGVAGRDVVVAPQGMQAGANEVSELQLPAGRDQGVVLGDDTCGRSTDIGRPRPGVEASHCLRRLHDRGRVVPASLVE